MVSTLQKISEKDLITLLRNNDRAGYEYLYDNYSGSLYGVINRIVNNEDIADDILQDVFVKIWTNMARYDDKKGKLFTWMINISRNMAIDTVRSKGYSNAQKNDSTELVKSKINTIRGTDIKPENIGLMEFVNKLAVNERFLVNLMYFQGYTQSEISVEYNIPLGTVKSRLRNAAINLKQLLADKA
jgi:RNA polymerase sigma-70 factor (ECF subfamily)